MAFDRHTIHQIPEHLIQAARFAVSLAGLAPAKDQPKEFIEMENPLRSLDGNTAAKTSLDTKHIAGAARNATAAAIKSYFQSCSIHQRGTIKGTSAMLAPGAIQSSCQLEEAIAASMKEQQVPDDIAESWATGVAECWNAWFAGYRISMQFTGGSLSRVNTPVALASGKSSGEFRMSAVGLWSNLRRRLATYLEHSGAPESLEGFVQWLAKNFAEWKNQARVENVFCVLVELSEREAASRVQPRDAASAQFTAEAGFLSGMNFFSSDPEASQADSIA